MSETGADRPTAVLKEEHQTILRVIDVLERLMARATAGGGFEREACGDCVEFFRLFADACHHAKEEDLLFPVLEERGIPREDGPIGVMLEEHQLARGHTRAMAEALAARDRGEADAEARFHRAAAAYIDLLRNHIFKEDHVLFNMGDQMMRDEDQAALHTRFCDVGCRSFGGKRKEELARIAHGLQARWGQD